MTKWRSDHNLVFRTDSDGFNIDEILFRLNVNRKSNDEANNLAILLNDHKCNSVTDIKQLLDRYTSFIPLVTYTKSTKIQGLLLLTNEPTSVRESDISTVIHCKDAKYHTFTQVKHKTPDSILGKVWHHLIKHYTIQYDTLEVMHPNPHYIIIMKHGHRYIVKELPTQLTHILVEN